MKEKIFNSLFVFVYIERLSYLRAEIIIPNTTPQKVDTKFVKCRKKEKKIPTEETARK